MKRQLIITLFSFIALSLTACGGGGGSSDLSEMLGSWKGIYYLSDNNCPFEAYDQYEATLLVNQDLTKSVMEETTEDQGTLVFTGSTTSDSDSSSIEATNQYLDYCVDENDQPIDGNITIVRKIKISMGANGKLDVVRTQTFSGCSFGEVSCAREWRASFDRNTTAAE